MNCCHGNDNHHGNEHKGKYKGYILHIVMTVLCCGGPVILMLLLPLIGKVFPGAGIYLSKIVPFLCPMMMLAMIPMMFKKDKTNHANKTYENKN